jgi:hypothetical protein
MVGSGVLPREVAGLEPTKLAMRQSFVAILGVDGRDNRVPTPAMNVRSDPPAT